MDTRVTSIITQKAPNPFDQIFRDYDASGWSNARSHYLVTFMSLQE
jgi:hypothetical protein